MGFKTKLNSFFLELVMKSQKITGVDNMYFIKGGFWLFLSNAFNALFSIVLLILFTNFIDPRVFGEWRLFLTILTVVSIFSLPGMCTAIVQSVSKNYNSSYNRGMKIRFKYSIIGSLALLGVAGYFFYFETTSSYIPYLLAVLFFPFMYSLDSVMYFLSGKKEFKKLSKYKIVQNFAVYAALAVVLLLTKNLIFLVLIYLIFSVGMYIYYNINVTKELIKEDKKAIARKTDKGLHSFGLNMTIIQALQIIGSNIDKLIVAKYLGLVSLALYAIVNTLVENITSHTKILSVLLLPKFASYKPEESYKKIRQKLYLVFSGGIILFAIGYFLLPYAIPFLFSEKYASTVPYARIVILTIITMPLIHIFTSFLQAMKQVKILYWFRIVSHVVQIALFFVLIPLFGINGAVWSIVATQVLSLAFLLIFSGRSLEKAPNPVKNGF